MGVDEPVIQGDILVHDRSEVFPPVDVVSAHSHPESLVTGEVIKSFDYRLAQWNRSYNLRNFAFKEIING